MNYMGMGYLQRKLALFKTGVDKRYRYYAMDDRDNTRSIVMPDNVREMYRSVIEWTAKGVDSLADRIIFREFANDDLMLGKFLKLITRISFLIRLFNRR